MYDMSKYLYTTNIIKKTIRSKLYKLKLNNVLCCPVIPFPYFLPSLVAALRDSAKQAKKKLKIMKKSIFSISN